MEKNRNKKIIEESERIKEERRKDDTRDEVVNPTSEAMETGKESTPENKATRNVDSYDEFGSKKAGPAGYGDRPHKQPLTNRKMEQDSKERDEEIEKAEKVKKDKEREKRERQKEWGE